jgi:PAS domain S-box-containing protein
MISSPLKQEKKDIISIMTRLTEYALHMEDMENLLIFICTECVSFFNARFCLLRLIDKKGALPVKAFYGIDFHDTTPASLDHGEGIAGQVIMKGTPLIIKDLSLLSSLEGIPYNLNPQTMLCAPLKQGEQTIGTIELFDKKMYSKVVPFNKSDLHIFEPVLRVASLMIHTMELNKIKELSSEEKSEEDLDSFINKIYCPVVIIDTDNRIIKANRFLGPYLNRDINDIIGKDCSDIFFLNEQAHVPTLADIAFKTGKPDIHTFQGMFRGYPLCTRTTIYPVFDKSGKVEKAIIYIVDITEAMTYQDAILPLFNEVVQTKEYLESIIVNSADAIITTDTQGIVTSWNKGAEMIYGFTHKEAFAHFLPTVIDYMWEREKKWLEKIRSYATTKSRETIRQRKDGSLIEVSITESPILDTSGEVIGFCTISRDITEQKRIENALRRRNLELSRLFFINNVMRSTLEIDKVLKMTLTVVTMDDGLGYNRGIIFLVDEHERVLRGKTGIGPSSCSEAHRIWHSLPKESNTLEQVISNIIKDKNEHNTEFDKFCQEITIPLNRDTVLARSVKERRPFNIADVSKETAVDHELREKLSTEAFAVVPLITRNATAGLLWVDNLFNKKPISEEDFQFLIGFADSVASTLENAQLFEQVRMARSELERIFASISDMMYINDKDCTIIQINQAVIDRIKKPAEEIIGKKCYHIFHKQDTPWTECPHMETLRTGQSHIEEVVDPVLGGTFVVTISPIFDSTGNLTGTVHISRDVTELHNMRDKLIKTERKAALGEMAAQVAHEIRNPLTPIGGFARRLEKKLNGELKDYANIIVHEVSRLEYILKHTLSFVHESRLDKSTIDINDLVNDAVNLLKNEIKRRDNHLSLSLFHEALFVEIDRNRIKEALINIITNANEATENGTITISLAKEKEHVIISIQDSGKGIKQENINRIFDPFFTTRVSGTGLGLAITNRIIEEHKGIIKVSSIAGRGTKFAVYLPLKEA